MNPIIFNLKSITPTFLAGVDGKSFELRPSSVKGLMRFWWRACYWGENTTSISSAKINEKEGKLFGTTVKDGLKSPFSIRLFHEIPIQPSNEPFPKHNIMVTSRGRRFPINILEYLAYGTMEYQRGKGNVFIREYLPVGQKFSVKIIPTNNLKADDVKEIVKSFYYLSIFGGLGAKSRNGFGAFTVLNPEEFAKYGVDYSFSDEKVVNIVKKNENIPYYSAFSRRALIFELKKTPNSWDGCLAELGKIYRSARNNLERKHQYEKRQYIGAPIVAFKKYQSFLERRAKPYFLRIRRIDDHYKGHILYLPSIYCAGEKYDRNKQNIPKNVDQKFEEVCTQFNKYIKYEMEGKHE